MSVSTNGQICYGVVFEEDYEFSWDDASAFDDFDDWWILQTGWAWSSEEPFTADGDYAPGYDKDDPRIAAYFDSRRSWLAMHPAPVELVNYQSGECPAYILAIPSSLKTAHRGWPTSFDPSDLCVSSDDHFALIGFCERYELEYDDGPGWYLTSYWG